MSDEWTPTTPEDMAMWERFEQQQQQLDAEKLERWQLFLKWKEERAANAQKNLNRS